jgi:NhaP-type Na+/H+ or K+/H+ antiporter
MRTESWLLISGIVLVSLAIVGSLLKKLPISSSMIYLAAGFLIAKLGLQTLDAFTYKVLFHHATELAVILACFAAGLNMRATARLGRWSTTLRLALICMALTVAGVALAGVWGLGLPLGAAIFLGGALAPTDPVLASDVQVEHPRDTDRLRTGLTGEAGLNDGAAWPAVMLGLALLSQDPRGKWIDFLFKWLAIDTLWAVLGAAAIGTVLGGLAARFVIHLRVKHEEGLGRDDFLALGLMALTYAVAVKLHAAGYIAVFAAGLALRKIELRAEEKMGAKPQGEMEKAAKQEERKEGEESSGAGGERQATDPQTAHAFMADAVLSFNEKLERLAEGFVIVLVGVLLAGLKPSPALLWLIPLLFFVIRPVAVWLSLAGGQSTRLQRGFIAWFGVRGVASIYYVFYGMAHGLSDELSSQLLSIVVPLVAVSIVAHGISVTPLMKLYERKKGPREEMRPKWRPPQREVEA